MPTETTPPPPPDQPPSGTAGLPPQDIFQILGLQDLPEEEKKLLLEKLEQVIQEQVIHLIVSQLSDEQCQDLNEKMDQGMNQWQVIEYLKGKIPDLDQQIRQLVETFRDDLLAEVDDIRKEIAQGKTPSPHPVTKGFKKGYTKSTLPPSTQNQPSPLPPEVVEQLNQLNQAIDQATQNKQYDQLMELMNQRKTLKEQWGITE